MPTAEDLLTQLERLLGTWWVEPRSPGDDDPWPHGGRTTFEWHDARQHLVQASTVELPEAPDSVSIAGCDAANSTWFQEAARLAAMLAAEETGPRRHRPVV